MNIEKTVIDDLNAELSISLQPNDYQPQVEKALKDYRKKMQLPGFRTGQVPASLVKQRYGKSILAEEVNTLLQSKINEYLTENDIQILGSPIPTKEEEEVGNWDNPGEFKFKYQLGLAPQIELTLDKNLSFPYYKVDINDELITRQIKDLSRRYGKMSSPETSSEDCLLDGEFAELNEDGTLKEAGITNQTHIFIENINDGDTKNSLIGLKPGDSVIIDPHKLDKNHQVLADMLGITHDEVHSLKSKFQFTIREIKQLEPHELNQELFDKLYFNGTVTNEEQLKERVKVDLENTFSRDSDYILKRDFAQLITSKLNLQLPDEFLKKYISLVNEKPLSLETIEKEYPSYANQLKWELIQGQIIRQYDIRVTQEEALEHVKDSLKSKYASYGLPLDDDNLLTSLAKETLSKREESKSVYDSLYEDKILFIIKDNCNIEQKILPFDEFVHKAQHS